MLQRYAAPLLVVGREPDTVGDACEQEEDTAEHLLVESRPGCHQSHGFVETQARYPQPDLALVGVHRRPRQPSTSTSATSRCRRIRSHGSSRGTLPEPLATGCSADSRVASRPSLASTVGHVSAVPLRAASSWSRSTTGVATPC